MSSIQIQASRFARNWRMSSSVSKDRKGYVHDKMNMLRKDMKDLKFSIEFTIFDNYEKLSRSFSKLSALEERYKSNQIASSLNQRNLNVHSQEMIEIRRNTKDKKRKIAETFKKFKAEFIKENKIYFLVELERHKTESKIAIETLTKRLKEENDKNKKLNELLEVSINKNSSILNKKNEFNIKLQRIVSQIQDTKKDLHDLQSFVGMKTQDVIEIAKDKLIDKNQLRHPLKSIKLIQNQMIDIKYHIGKQQSFIKENLERGREEASQKCNFVRDQVNELRANVSYEIQQFKQSTIEDIQSNLQVLLKENERWKTKYLQLNEICKQFSGRFKEDLQAMKDNILQARHSAISKHEEEKEIEFSTDCAHSQSSHKLSKDLDKVLSHYTNSADKYIKIKEIVSKSIFSNIKDSIHELKDNVKQIVEEEHSNINLIEKELQEIATSSKKKKNEELTKITNEVSVLKNSLHDIRSQMLKTKENASFLTQSILSTYSQKQITSDSIRNGISEDLYEFQSFLTDAYNSITDRLYSESFSADLNFDCRVPVEQSGLSESDLNLTRMDRIPEDKPMLKRIQFKFKKFREILFDIRADVMDAQMDMFTEPHLKDVNQEKNKQIKNELQDTQGFIQTQSHIIKKELAKFSNEITSSMTLLQECIQKPSQ